jgi:ubiquinone/menaquinone biosynthesis C-methylase UbiE
MTAVRRKWKRYSLRMNRLRWSVLPLVAISVAFGQTEDQYRQFIAHVQNALALKAGAVVADIGTGDSPEHPLHISKAVGETGKVICVDINQKAIETLQRKLDESGAVNVQTQLGKPDDPMLPVSGSDAVLISFAYHEMVEHEAMLAHIRSALRADGRLVVIEAISEKNRQVPRERQIKDHELSPDILTGELTAAGFEIPNGVETLSDKGGDLRYLVAARMPK